MNCRLTFLRLQFLAGMALVMYNKVGLVPFVSCVAALEDRLLTLSFDDAQYILSTLDFPYPIFLTTCHMGFAVSLALLTSFSPARY